MGQGWRGGDQQRWIKKIPYVNVDKGGVGSKTLINQKWISCRVFFQPFPQSQNVFYMFYVSFT